MARSGIGTGDLPASLPRALYWAAAYGVMVAILLLPALLNGFPFIYADTGGYLIRPFLRNLELGRSALYGSFLATGIPFDFWPNVIIQALISAWIVSLIMRVHGLGRPVIAVAAIGALSAVTGLPWYAGQLMPDVFLPLSVLALYLVAFASARLRKLEIAALIGIIAFAIAAHMTIFAIMVMLFAFFIVLCAHAKRITLPRPQLSPAAVSIVAGAALALTTNYMVAGVAAFTPGGETFLFARLLQDGFVKTYLERDCPDPTLSLCRYRDALPASSDDWLWGGGSTLGQLGGWRAFAPEARRIIIGSILQQPGAHLRAAVTDVFAQLGAVSTGEKFDARYNWHTEWVLRNYAPQTLPHFYAAGQQQNAIDFRLMNVLQVPLALGATVLLPILIVLCWRRRAAATALLLTVFIAAVGNAAVCATFSGTFDRYQNRIVWITVLAAFLACYELLKSAPIRGGRSLVKPINGLTFALEANEPAETGSANSLELTILMPCLDEAETLAVCIGKANSFFIRCGVTGEILIADNGSTDGSPVLAERCGARVITVPERGYGAALRAGIAAARGHFVIMGDADASYDFARLDPFLAELRDGCDLVMGNRFAGGIARGAMPPLHRYLGNPVLSLLGRLFFRTAVRDFHCGLRGFRRDAILALNLCSPGMEFATELVVRAALAKFDISEVPTTLAVDGRSRPPHLRTWYDGWRHLRFLLVFRAVECGKKLYPTAPEKCSVGRQAVWQK